MKKLLTKQGHSLSQHYWTKTLNLQLDKFAQDGWIEMLCFEWAVVPGLWLDMAGVGEDSD